jgi:hypothetical protein
MKFIVKKKTVEEFQPFITKRRMSKSSLRLLSEGKRFVEFVVPIETWNNFKIKVCKDEKPNDVFNRLIKELVGEK